MDHLTFSRLVARLQVSEGWRDKVYMDTTGHLTIGYGLNLAKVRVVDGTGRLELTPINGLTEAEGTAVLQRQILETEGEWKRQTWYDALDPVRQEVLLELGFNMGVPKILSFTGFIGQVRTGRFGLAAANMRSWLWYKQVHEARAEPLCRMMESGLVEAG